MAALIIHRGLSKPDTSESFTPHKSARPEKLGDQEPFNIVSDYSPARDQPTVFA